MFQGKTIVIQTRFKLSRVIDPLRDPQSGFIQVKAPSFEVSQEGFGGKALAIPLLGLNLRVKVGHEEPMTLFGSMPDDENVDGANLVALSKADPT